MAWIGLLGSKAVAGVGVGGMYTWLSQGLASMARMGGQVQVAQHIGKGNRDEANKYAQTAVQLATLMGLVYAAIVLLFLNPLLYLFGVTPDVLPYAQDYTFITAFGIPFLVSTTGGTHLIRADRSPTYSMTCMLVGAIINTILDPLFIFTFNWGIKGAAWATVIGQFVSGLLVIIYFVK